MKRHVIEFIGTFFVVLAVCLTENPMAIGLMYMALLYIGARISGAHYNPGVTVALWLRGDICYTSYLELLGSAIVGSICCVII